ncbi:MAG: efflux RND transporter permease subunit, partial [Chloroflexia bacterium]|nr:efflux RND transporter permease subunit [Chloroflexia bacterium]
MSRFFSQITQISLKLRWVTVALSVALLVLGGIALVQLNQELLPPIEFPAIVTMTFWPGASSDEVLQQVTIPQEQALQAIEGIVNVESYTGQGFAAINMSTEFGLDQDELKAQIRRVLQEVPLPEGVEKPELLSFGIGDLPVVVASVSSSQVPLPELKAQVEDSILPQLAGIPGIEDIGVSGGQELPEEPVAVEPPQRPGVPLPPEWVEGASAMGQQIETTADLNAEMMGFIVQFQPESLQLLTLEMWQAFPPAVLAAVPEAALEYVNPEIAEQVAELLAHPGGAGGALGGTAVEVPAEAPELPESWRQPPESEGPVQVEFETAADLLDNPFDLPAAQLLNMLVQMGSLPNVPELLGDLTPEVILWLQSQDPGFLPGLEPAVLRLLSPEVLRALPMDFVDALEPGLHSELAAIASGTVEPFVPTEIINRTNGNPSLALVFYKGSTENTVAVAHAIFDKLEELDQANGELNFDVAFEQSSFIEESVSGVAREGSLGALFAVVVILLFLSGFVNGRYRLSWRSTLVTAVSIPMSVLMGFAAMRWLPALHPAFSALADGSSGVPVLNAITELLARLFPKQMTLNIMTLSGMTVAVGRVVDDSIVVLENIYRHIQRGDERRAAVIGGTRDVAIAIFASTLTTVIVFLPLGLIGGLVGEFFLPFGLTVTYALGASFIVAITVVPVLAYLFIRKEHLPQAKETWLQRSYTPLLKWSLGHRFWTLLIAAVLFAGSLLLL